MVVECTSRVRSEACMAPRDRRRRPMQGRELLRSLATGHAERVRIEKDMFHVLTVAVGAPTVYVCTYGRSYSFELI